MTVTATVVFENLIDTAETVETSTGHRLQYGGRDGDGFCYSHQSFDCFDTLTVEEREAINHAEPSQEVLAKRAEFLAACAAEPEPQF